VSVFGVSGWTDLNTLVAVKWLCFVFCRDSCRERSFHGVLDYLGHFLLRIRMISSVRHAVDQFRSIKLEENPMRLYYISERFQGNHVFQL
jgi:hypothetical protein